MNDYIKDYLTEIIVTSAAFGASFILNCVLAFKLYTKPKIEIYTPIDYKKQNITYCSMPITDNPFYDL